MFAKYGIYDAVGLFSTTHLITMVVLFFAVLMLAISTKKMSKKCYLMILRVMAIVFTCLELMKMIWTWCNGNFIIDAWAPLFFCSLFIYALWLTWFKNPKVQEVGLSFIGLGGIVAGIAFIIFPTTSFRWFPIWHFQCLYSMLYHSAMVYAGIMCFVTKSIKINLKTIIKYCFFTLSFILFAIGINLIKGSNLMFMNHPSAIPLEMLHIVYNFSPVLYTCLMVFTHTVIIGFGMAALVLLIQKIIALKANRK